MLLVFWLSCFWLFTSGFFFSSKLSLFFVLFCFAFVFYVICFDVFCICLLCFLIYVALVLFLCVFCFVVLLALLFMLFLAFEFGLIVGLCFVLHFKVVYVSCPCLFMKRVHAFIFGMQECLFSTHYLL